MTKKRKGRRARNRARNSHTNQHALQTRRTYKLKRQLQKLAYQLGIPYGRRKQQ